MRYALFDLQREAMRPMTALLAVAEDWARSPVYPLSDTPVGRFQAAWFESLGRLMRTYPKQSWVYPDVQVGDELCPVHRSIIRRKPFGNLIRFRREGLPKDAPRVLFVAAMSGHYATLSKETFQEFLPDHEVYVTDWVDARQVPLSAGKFGFEEYVTYVIEFLQVTGPDTHVVGLCQAAVPALVATSVMSRDGDAARPKTLTLVAGPVDIRVNPNQMLNRAQNLSVKRLKQAAIYRVPSRFPGAGRRVYPGALQIMGFMSLNVKLHAQKHLEFFRNVYKGREDEAQKHREFYNEYFAMMDTSADFYLETLQRVFMDQHLPKGLMQYKGQTVTCEPIVDVPLLTMEGADDNMVNVGQTAAAVDLCENLPNRLKEAYVQQGVGHYGIFSGSLYRAEVAPKIKSFQKRHAAPRDETALARSRKRAASS